MPVYITAPDLSLADLVEQIQARGEKIVLGQKDGSGNWELITEYAATRPEAGQSETR